MGKRLDLLREVVPKGSAVGVLWHADNVASMTSVRELDTAAGRAQVALQSHSIRDPGDFAAAFESMKRGRVAGLIVIHAALIYGHRELIIELARKHKLPAVYGASEYADAGGLLAYGPSYPDLFRRAAVYVDKIAKGAKPAELPIEQASVFELVVNSRAARAIDIALPPAMLARATRVIG
jgi:putative ABC transport system substrate-binding protein